MKKFDKDKYLKKLKLKRKWRSYSRYVYIAVPCVLCCLLCLYFAYSKFFVSEEQAAIRTTVGDFIYGDVVISAYIDGEYSSTIPGKNDGYVVDKVSCDNGAVGEWNNIDWGLLTTNLTKRTKCNVYFHKDYLAPIIAQLDSTGKCPTMNADGSVNVTGVEATDGYLCKAKDSYGDSYYYRGNVTNNYVKFADKYWRIVRINGDGTVRVIYDGTSAHANGEANEDRQIGTSAFNSSYNDNVYVGYMYGQTGASTYAETHANTNNSAIKTYLDTWYENNIKGTANEQYLADNVFCNDRSISSNKPSSYNNLGYGTNATAYRWYYGPWDGNGYNTKMMLTCPQKNDAFTVNDTIKGNGALTYGIGLLTADEVVLAGGWSSSNYNYYLYSGKDYWLASPYFFFFDPPISAIAARGLFVNFRGYFSSNYVRSGLGARPVFNLKAEVLKYGDGTASNPYRLTESLDNSSSSESGGIDTGD